MFCLDSLEIRCSGNRGGKGGVCPEQFRDLRRVILEQIKDYNQFPEDWTGTLGLAIDEGNDRCFRMTSGWWRPAENY
ncbi:MAG: hypothetical protein ACLSUW_03680 [Akkermansia sp.]